MLGHKKLRLYQSPGSFAAYFLGMADIDPLVNDLSFEFLLNPNGKSIETIFAVPFGRSFFMPCRSIFPSSK